MKWYFAILCASLTGAKVIEEDSYFYGQSPSVYPSPKITGTDRWARAYEKASKLLTKFTLEEKIALTHGPGPQNGCNGHIDPNPRVGFSGLCLQDAGNGVRGHSYVNAYPAGLSVAASWNKDLAKARGHYMYKEFRTKGAHIVLGPVVGAQGRVVTGGRLWEGFGADPFLAGVLASKTIEAGLDVGVQSSVKHYLANEQETNRSPSKDVGAVSSNVDDKTMHELYLWPFQDTVKAGAASVMCSYNRVNNSHSCANSKILNGYLKTELGFQGFVVSDWGSGASGVPAIRAGLDMSMPVTEYMNETVFVQAIKNGSLPVTRLDDMATRILAAWYLAGQDAKDYPPFAVGLPLDATKPHKVINARDPSAKGTLLSGALEGHVLVKNIRGALPLRKPLMTNVFGYDAHAPRMYGGSGDKSGYLVGFASANVTQVILAIQGPLNEPFQKIAVNGTIFSGGGSGANSAPYISSPFDALSARAYEDETTISWDFESRNPKINANVDVCLVFINSFSSEAADRPALYDKGSDELVLSVADNCSNTIVVIHNVGATIVDAYYDHPNVTAIVYAHVPGQDSGRALVKLLYGDENFSGKLPYTVAKKESDYDTLLFPTRPEGDYKKFPQSDFNEGVNIDYRYFESKNITPRFEFGFGISYTTFGYSNLAINKVNSSYAAYPRGKIESGGQRDLWDIIAEINVDVRNTGRVNGQEVAQRYIKRPDGSKWLRGFEKVLLQPGQSNKITLPLGRRDLSEWDTKAHKWKLIHGNIIVMVGSSCKDLPLSGTLRLQEGQT